MCKHRNKRKQFGGNQMNQKNQYDPYYQDPTGSQNTKTPNNPYMQNNHPSHRQSMHYTNTNDNGQAIYPYDEYDDQYDEDYEDEYDETSSHYDDPFVDMQKEPEEEKKKVSLKSVISRKIRNSRLRLTGKH